jgi:V8-like Glu-specific endopeptidase
MTQGNGKNAASRYLRKLSRVSAAGGVEAAGESAEAFSENRAEEAHERAIDSIERESQAKLDKTSRDELKKLFLGDGAEALSKLKSDGERADLTDEEQGALEAIVVMDGSRPTMALSADDRLDLGDPTLGQWKDVTKKFADQITRVASAVGRIDLDGEHRGTGFAVKDGLVLTNRHVLQELAEEVDPKNKKWRFRGEPSITFDANPNESRTRQFKLKTEVILAGPDAINRMSIDYNRLDFAILECIVPAGARLPEPLELENDADKVVEGRPIFTLGYPAKPAPGAYQWDVLHKHFRNRYSVKRFAPGEIDRGLGTRAAGTGETVFTHDTTTLGGNSGSCVVDLGNDGRLVVGLHFAGMPKTANYAHSQATLKKSFEALELDWKEWI